MILLPVVALLVGALVALLVRIGPLGGALAQYLAVGCLAGLDTVLGGVRAGLEGKFRNDVFVTGFLSNVVIALGLAWLGDQIYINLFTAVALVFALRIFNNLATIRRIGLTAYIDARRRRELAQLESGTRSQVEEPSA